MSKWTYSLMVKRPVVNWKNEGSNPKLPIFTTRPPTSYYFFKNFWALTAGGLGTYEALAIASGKKIPVISRIVSKRKATRVLLIAWLAGLAHHIWKYELEDLTEL